MLVKHRGLNLVAVPTLALGLGSPRGDNRASSLRHSEH